MEINYAFKYLSPKVEIGVCQERCAFMCWIRGKERLLLRGETGKGFIYGGRDL